MTATEAHDLLLACKTTINDMPIWEFGKGQFGNILYCRHCHYSKAHGHGHGCIIKRLERATETESERHE